MNAPVLNMGTVPPGAMRYAVPVVGMDGVGLNRESTRNETIADVAITAGDVVTNLVVNSSSLVGTVAKNAGPIGTAASAGFSLVGTSVQNAREMERLLALYRNTVAAQMRIAPEQVNEADLRAAAGKFPENKALWEEIERLDAREVNRPIRSLVTGAAAIGGGLVGSIPGSFAASFAADKAMDCVLGKEGNTAFTALQQIEAKLHAGQGVSAHDMFMFHVVADKNLAAQIEGHMGESFEDLPEEKQTRTMLRDHPALTELCKFEAYLINNKALPPASLMDERMQLAVRQQFEQMQTVAQQPSSRILTGGYQVSPLMPPTQIQERSAIAGANGDKPLIAPRPQPGGYAQVVAQQRNDPPSPSQGQSLN